MKLPVHRLSVAKQRALHRLSVRDPFSVGREAFVDVIRRGAEVN